MRKWLRRKARAAMRKRGFAHINRKGADGKSFFAKHWREYI